MKTKCFKVIVSVLTIMAVVTLHLSIREKTSWNVLMQENVEALTFLETDNPYYPCVSASGYCLRDGIITYGIALKK